MSTLPEFFQPNRVSSPTITAPAWSASTNTCSTNSSGVSLGELDGELHDQHGVEAGPGEQLQPLRQRGERSRCALREEHGQRVRVEGHRDGRRAARGGLLDQLREDRAVTAVHPVEVAEGDDGTAEVGGDLREAVPDVHGDTLEGASPASASVPCAPPTAQPQRGSAQRDEQRGDRQRPQADVPVPARYADEDEDRPSLPAYPAPGHLPCSRVPCEDGVGVGVGGRRGARRGGGEAVGDGGGTVAWARRRHRCR